MDLTYYRTLWNDPAIETRIADGIERHRKTDAVIHVTDADGHPLAGIELEIEQIASDFRFGANCFMLGAYPDAATNAAYEAAFADIFNAATVPFYWKGLEPERGRPRYGKDSPPVARRPPPDLALEFCERHGLTRHGHTLVWDLAQWSVPDWVPDDPAASAPLWEARVRDIAARYGDHIPRWDVLNEVITGSPRHPRSRLMPADYDRLAFAWAEKYLPSSAEFWFNEVTESWIELRASTLDAIARLRDGGARLDGLGLQFHLFQESDVRAVLDGLRFRPRDLLAALDAYGALGLPIHVSEITLPVLADAPDGEEVQAELARNFYRLWFSHPATAAITWWNLPDGGAATGEDKVHSGLVRKDLSPKPACLTLGKLIRKEWRTHCKLVTDSQGCAAFRGFDGNYHVAGKGRRWNFALSRASADRPWHVII